MTSPRRQRTGPVVRQRLADLMIRVERMKYHSYRQLTDALRRRPPGIGASVNKLVSTELNHDIATMALEIMEALPQFDVIVVPLGGGGLASGVGLAVRAAAPRATVVGVEVEASSPFTLSLEAGRITAITPRASLADGLVGNLEAGSITFPLVRQVVDYVVTVSEDDLTAPCAGWAPRSA